VPQGLYEEWTCQISWPHFRNTEPRMLDLYAGTPTANTKVCRLLSNLRRTLINVSANRSFYIHIPELSGSSGASSSSSTEREINED
jgi:hypothetical protein